MRRLAIITIFATLLLFIAGIQTFFSLGMESMGDGHRMMQINDCISTCLSNAINAVTDVSTMPIVFFAIPVLLALFASAPTRELLRILPIITGPPDPRLRQLVVRRE